MSNNMSSDQVQLILDQFAFYIEPIGWDRVRDKIVIEIGPGDAIPHGLLFLGAGAKRYIAIDRFLGNVTNNSAQDLYRAVIELAPARVKRGLVEARIDIHQYLELILRKQYSQVQLIFKSMEEVDFKDIDSADIILSYNVIEHLSNLSQAFENMARWLNSGGLMIHRIDYGPHDMWRTYRNPLTFLTVSKAVWSIMGSNRGYPNRKRHSQVLSILEKCGFRSADRITGHFAKEDVEKIKPFLSDEFQALYDEDLCVADAEVYSSLSSHPVFGEQSFRHTSTSLNLQ